MWETRGKNSQNSAPRLNLSDQETMEQTFLNFDN